MTKQRTRDSKDPCRVDHLSKMDFTDPNDENMSVASNSTAFK